MLRAVVLTQYRRVTEGQTDGQTDEIAVASTMRALWRVVKTALTSCANNNWPTPIISASLVGNHVHLKIPELYVWFIIMITC